MCAHLQPIDAFSCSEPTLDFVHAARLTGTSGATVSIRVICLGQYAAAWDQAKALF